MGTRNQMDFKKCVDSAFCTALRSNRLNLITKPKPRLSQASLFLAELQSFWIRVWKGPGVTDHEGSASNDRRALELSKRTQSATVGVSTMQGPCTATWPSGFNQLWGFEYSRGGLTYTFATDSEQCHCSRGKQSVAWAPRGKFEKLQKIVPGGTIVRYEFATDGSFVHDIQNRLSA